MGRVTSDRLVVCVHNVHDPGFRGLVIVGGVSGLKKRSNWVQKMDMSPLQQPTERRPQNSSIRELNMYAASSCLKTEPVRLINITTCWAHFTFPNRTKGLNDLVKVPSPSAYPL